MSIDQAIWKVDESPIQLASCSLDTEDELEEMICRNMGILNENWLPVGRQVPTEHGGCLDILAINENGNLIVIELKKSKTPREVVTQAMDYASWVRGISLTTIAGVYESSRERLHSPYESLDEALRDKFGKVVTEEEVDGAHQIVIVASALDASTS